MTKHRTTPRRSTVARRIPHEPNIRMDVRRRLRNALLVILRAHPRPLAWIEQNLPPRYEDCLQPSQIQLIETASRWLALKPYGFLHREQIGQLIFADWPFNDRGHLTPG